MLGNTAEEKVAADDVKGEGMAVVRNRDWQQCHQKHPSLSPPSQPTCFPAFLYCVQVHEHSRISIAAIAFAVDLVEEVICKCEKETHQARWQQTRKH
jgi:hypothetical protein